MHILFYNGFSNDSMGGKRQMGKEDIIFRWNRKEEGLSGDQEGGTQVSSSGSRGLPSCLPAEWREKIEAGESPFGESMVGCGTQECGCGEHIIHWFNAPPAWSPEQRIAMEATIPKEADSPPSRSAAVSLAAAR